MANITKAYVERAEPKPDGSQALYFDDLIKGFGVRVTKSTKTFILDRKLEGKTVRLSIGRFPDWSVQQAREHARDLIVQMDKGIDVRQKARDQAASHLTLQQVLDDYLKEKDLKERTKKDYQYYADHYFVDWLGRALISIDSAMVITRFAKIKDSSSGKAQANSAMRMLRALFNDAQAKYGAQAIPLNPVRTLSERRLWAKEAPKSDHLAPAQIPEFLRALRRWPNRVMGCYLEFILLTGARRREASTLKWEDVNLHTKVLVFKDTKNGEHRSIPITKRIDELLREVGQTKGGRYVFCSKDKDGKASYIQEPRKALSAANRAAQSEVTVHGLRRTFATVLESLDCPAYPLKTLLGHSTRADVTASHYTQISVERLRIWMDRYEAYLVAAAGAMQ